MSADIDPTSLLPGPPVQFIDEGGHRVLSQRYPMPEPKQLIEAYRAMVIGRRIDQQVQSLVKQGQLAVYPSSAGQEACQIGSVLALKPTDWLFPTYREAIALITRGVDAMSVLTMLRGDWHCGYDPYQHHAAPQSTPLATQLIHAMGLAHAARLRGHDTVALAYVGDGATSEGDFHEALNFAAVFTAPVIYFIQNNQYAISVPLSKQTKAPSLAAKGVGYGIPGIRVDGNDVAAVIAVVTHAAQRARTGLGPTLIEAHTYRMGAHTNADDATRYRHDDEVKRWSARDPLRRLMTYLLNDNLIDTAEIDLLNGEAEDAALDLRTRMLAGTPPLPPEELFENVYRRRTPQLDGQLALLQAELAAGGVN